ncbi:MAG: DUF2075 domain-containing protein [Clostridiales bacterium]|nr:DUF2075 domain-containing protein [Clostridiales bacterium]
MGELFSMKIGDAYQKSLSNDLADEIWEYKHPDEDVNREDREYISWLNSLPRFLECAHNADLDDVIVVLEMKTPISNKAIDVLLVGKSSEGENRVLIVELKQWTSISTKYVNNSGKVYVPEAHATRKHPMRQLNLYQDNLMNHHSGIQTARVNGADIQIGKIAYLHNFVNKTILYTGAYDKWSSEGNNIFGSGEDEKGRLTRVLGQCFVNSEEESLLHILENYEAIMGDEGLAGLRKAYKNEASLTMQADQQGITDFVITHLQNQLTNPRKEIIVISGGPGTGKTIVGIRFILEYVNLFNNGRNDNKAIFCLPKSQTVKAMFDAACAVDEENGKEYCCYLQEISRNQNMVVVDEAHRITNLESTLNDVFDKGTKLLILLQDDHQLVRPGEEGTFEAFKQYAENRGILFSPISMGDKRTLTLIDEKRCDENLLNGVTKLFYNNHLEITTPIENIKIFDDLNDLANWKNRESTNSRTKYILPFCWKWNSRNQNDREDIVIEDFRLTWNPEDTDDQVIWLNDASDDRAACIYTSQGLDMDNVAFIWWDDLVWDEDNQCWKGNPTKLQDPAFRCERDSQSDLWCQTKWDWNSKRSVRVKNGYKLSQEEMNQLIMNTYYVMLTRPRNSIGIWFRDEVTKRHVMQVLGISAE